MRIVSGASTDKGQVREVNEDSYLVDRHLELFAVADGMGGHRAGEIASATALDGLRGAVAEGIGVADAVGRANTAVWDMAAADTELAGMGTTLTAAWFDGATLTIGHVGDSRAYLLRDDRLERLTTDHSLVEELIRDGKLTEEQAAVHPQRSIITRALGVDSTVAVDVYSLLLEPADRVVLCSDGLTSMVRASGIAEILRREADPTAAANALVDAANAAGGDDNITALVLDAVSDGRDPLPSSVAAAITGRTVLAGADVDAETAVIAEVVARPPVAVTTESTSIDATPAPAGTDREPRVVPSRADRRTRRARGPANTARTVMRIVSFAAPIVAILGLAFVALGWYAQNSYFVGFERGALVVYQGQHGGLLFWDPEVVERTGIPRYRLSEEFRASIGDHKDFSSEEAALAFVGRARRTLGPTTTSSTTAPGATSSSTSSSTTTSSSTSTTRP